MAMRPRPVRNLAVLGAMMGLLLAGIATPSFAFVGTPGGLGLSVDSGQTLAGQAAIYAGGGATHDVAMSVDGMPVPVTPTDSPPALVMFEGSGIQSGSQNLQNSLWVNGRLVTLIKHDYSNFETATIPVPAGFLQPGTNVVRVRSGDSVSPTDLVGNHDDFTIRNLRLVLPSTDALTDPAISPTQPISLGDGFPGGNATEDEVVADFSITATADQLDGIIGAFDTTTVPDGPETITATGTRADGSTISISAQVIIDNTPPQIAITSPAADANYQAVDVTMAAQADDATSQVASVTGTLDGNAIPIPDTFPSDNILPGRHTLTVTAADSAGNSTSTTRTFITSIGAIPGYDRGQIGHPPYAGPDGPTMVVAGDIACSPGSTPTPTTCQQAGTAELVKTLNPDAVASLGDEQYDVGTIGNFTGSYDQTWGQFKDLTYPLIGNHEYAQANYPGAQAPGYFDYFNGTGNADGRAGDRDRGYYSYDLGAWHVVVLNADCGVVSCATGSGQQTWLARDLASHHNYCTMALWHQPLFTAGTTFNDGNGLATKPLWDTLYSAGADLVINGHDHNYQRYTPQTPAGQGDAKYGISEFIVGTGGDSHFPLSNKDKVTNLVSSADDTFGVLQLHLNPAGYNWHFVPEPGNGNGTFTDSGSASCHDAPPAN